MKKLAAITVSTGTVAVVVLNGVAVMASSGSGSSGSSGGSSTSTSTSGDWPASMPLPTSPGTVLSQSATTATVRSTDMPFDVQNKLDTLYVTQKGCTRRFAVNRPRDYVCFNPATGETDEVWFTFAALDPKPTDPSRSQTNAFLVRG